jgi:hypothetical protein
MYFDVYRAFKTPPITETEATRRTEVVTPVLIAAA